MNKLRQYASTWKQMHLEASEMLLGVQKSFVGIYGQQYTKTAMYALRRRDIAAHQFKASLWSLLTKD